MDYRVEKKLGVEYKYGLDKVTKTYRSHYILGFVKAVIESGLEADNLCDYRRYFKRIEEMIWEAEQLERDGK